MSNASNLSTLANVLDDANAGEFLKSTGSGGVAFDTVAAGATVYSSASDLPLTGNTVGDMAYVSAATTAKVVNQTTGSVSTEDATRLYIYSGTGWYSVAFITQNPTISTVQDAGGGSTPFTLATDGTTATVVTITANDPESVPLTYSYSVTSGSLNGCTVTGADGTSARVAGTAYTDNVFTVTPHASQDATFTITFTASDGINQATSANAFSLSFVTIVTDSNHTTLLATATGTSDNNYITDSSSNSHSITVNGDTYAGTFSPYRSGGYSSYFDGAGDYLEISDDSSLQLGTGNFTIEAWVYPTSWSNSTLMTILSKRNSSTTGYWRLGVTGGNGTVSFQTGASGTEFTLTSPSSDRISLNEWSHIAVTKSGSTAYLYINGSEVATDTNASVNIDFVGKPVRVGAVDSTPTFFWNGYVTDARVVKGTVITPPTGGPTERLEAVTNTSLLTCHLPYIADGSTNDHSITVNGDVSTKPFSPYNYNEYSATFNGGSVYFVGGSGDYLKIDNVAFSGDLTFECWFNQTVAHTGSYQCVFSSSTYASGIPIRFYTRNDDISIWTSGSSGPHLTTKFQSNVWYHVAVVRYSGTWTLYVNGKSVDTTTTGGAYDFSSTVDWSFGGSATGSYPFAGYVSDVRFTDSRVYTGEFIPPIAPLSTSSAKFHIKGADASIIDKSQVSNLKLEGNTTGSTDLGANSDAYSGSGKYIKFDGSDDYVFVSASSFLDISSSDITIEGYFYTTSTSVKQGVWEFYSDDSNYARLFFEGGNGNVFRLTLNSAGTQRLNATGTTTLSINTWYHIAVTRDHSSGAWKTYIGGVQDTGASGTESAAVDTSLWNFEIGRDRVATNRYWNGYIQDFRITKDKARYTANFTPPSAPLEG